MELNYEAKQYYQITVIIEDMKGTEARGGKASHTFTITVLDANDAPQLAPGIVLPLPENSQVGNNLLTPLNTLLTPINNLLTPDNSQVGAKTAASFSATDVDSATTLTYAITAQVHNKPIHAYKQPSSSV